MTKHILLILLIVLSLTDFSYSDEKAKERALTLNKGDSRELVRGKWGSPAQIDRSLKDGVPKEVWIYTCEYLEPCIDCTNYYFELPCYYLFFENKKLESWQDVR